MTAFIRTGECPIGAAEGDSARITITPKTAIITKPTASLWSEVWRIAYSSSAYSGSWSIRRRSKSSLRTLPFDSSAESTALASIDQAQHAIIMPGSQQIKASSGQCGNVAEHVGNLPGHAHRRMAEGDDRAAVFRDRFVVEGIK
jgi:hypothetical protein